MADGAALDGLTAALNPLLHRESSWMIGEQVRRHRVDGSAPM